MRRLFGNAREERAQLLGLYDTDGVAVHEQEVQVPDLRGTSRNAMPRPAPGANCR